MSSKFFGNKSEQKTDKKGKPKTGKSNTNVNKSSSTKKSGRGK
jgi:hypothetical protein